MPLSEQELEDALAVLYERVKLLEQLVNAHVGIDARQGMPHPSQKVQALEFGSGLILSPALSGPPSGAVLTANPLVQGGLEWTLPDYGGVLTKLYDARFSPTTSLYVPLTRHNRGAASVTVAAGTCYFVPFTIGQSLTLSLFGIAVTAAASGTAEIAIYDDDGTNGRPLTRLVRVSGLDTSTTGVKSASISLSLTPGIYWAALRCTAAPSLAGASSCPVIAIDASGTQYTLLQNSDTALNNPVTTDPTTLSSMVPPVFYARYA